ncbi:hypothetical protein ID866_3402 [Astraeus odoratus]|nr:hypothetical protein ID866_3402 [Astraeus odoratus]
MANVATLYIDDDSPEITYFPSVNLEPSANVTTGWQLLYSGSGAAVAPGQVGVGTSYHYTNLNGTSLMVQWNGTGIDLMGSVSNASYLITLDGDTLPSSSYGQTNTVLASLHDLDSATHTLSLMSLINDPGTPNAFLTLDRVAITYPPPGANESTNATPYIIDDSDIAFMGQWNYVTDGTGSPMHVSATAGDRAGTSFTGSAITIYGLISSYSGRYTVIIDNVTTTMTAQSSYNNSDALLFFATNLSQAGSHQLTIVNEDDRTFAIRVGGMNVTAYGNATSTSAPSASTTSTAASAGTIAALVLAAVLVLVVSVILYRFWVKRKRGYSKRNPMSMHRRHNIRDEKNNADPRRTCAISLPSGEEDLESNNLSASKGYGFGLGLRRGFPFAYRKAKQKGGSSSKSGGLSRYESHPMTPQYDRDDKRLSLSTLAADVPVLSYVPESEKLAPGWTNPAARTSHASDPRVGVANYGRLVPELRIEDVGDDDGDDDAETLTSRQGEALAATLSLSPRTSEAPTASRFPSEGFNVADERSPRQLGRDVHYLQVRETSPFRLDVGAIFTSLKGKRDSRSTNGSAGSTWSKVRTRLYRKAHKDDGRQSFHTYPIESSSSSGPESVPVVMHKSGCDAPPSATAPVSGTYSFLDFASSRQSIRRQSKLNRANTVSSGPADSGREKLRSAWSDNTSAGMVRTEHNETDATPPLKPDAPSTISRGSNTLSPSDNSNGHSHPSALTTNTQGSAPFPFPVSIPPSVHLPHPFNAVAVEERSPSPARSPSLQSPVEHPRVFVDPPEDSPTSYAHSPTESVPFSVSDIHFRHSFSDYTAIDSRRTSENSGLPPHPPLPHHDGSHSATPTYTPPPPYIVQRVLGMAPLHVPSPAARLAGQYPSSATLTPHTGTIPRHPRTAPSSAPPLRPVFRLGILGPRPRPSTSEPTRTSTTPQLPLQGGRGNLRGPR